MAEVEVGFEYDVALSFAGEDREYVERVADALVDLGVRVFYDRYETAGLWGKDLYAHLDWVYRRAARFCVLFVSGSYSEKVWTNHERSSAQARAIEENMEYVLPARFDDTELPGLRPTVGHVDLRHIEPADLAALVREKLGDPPTANFWPPRPDTLLKALEVEDAAQAKLIQDRAKRLFGSLGRTTEDERLALAAMIQHGCRVELPENLHADVDLLARVLGWSAPTVLQTLGGMRSLGIVGRVRDTNDHHDPVHDLGEPATYVEVTFLVLARHPVGGNATDIAAKLLNNLCEHHGALAMVNLDFAHLATSTVRPGWVHDE